jgi:Lon protease-like protein
MPSGLPPLVPLFPLPNVVLFPRIRLPLHVFEPRYRQMVKDALEGPRLIGMTLLQPGWESDYHGRPKVFPIGCAGRLERCEPLADGRFDILLVGLSRFRVLSEEPAEQPYRLARVEALPDTAGDEAGIGALRRSLVAAMGEASDGPSTLMFQREMSDELFVNGLCQALPLAPIERQALLDEGDLAARARRLLAILEFRALEARLGGSGNRVH